MVNREFHKSKVPRILVAIAAVPVAVAALSCSPNPVVELKTIAHYDTPGWAHDVAPYQGLLYVSDRQGGIIIFERAAGWMRPRIQTPALDVISLAPHEGRPVLASRYEGLVMANSDGGVAARLSLGEIANAAETREDLVYAAYGAHGLVIARIGESDLSLVTELPTRGWSHDVKLWGNHALLADWDYGLRVVDINDPEHPKEVGVLGTRATAISIAIQEKGSRTIAAVAEGHGGVSLVAFDTAGRPSRIARHSLGLDPRDKTHPKTGGWAHGAALCGNYLFVANWKNGLYVLDVADPSQPHILMKKPTAGTALGVKAEAEPEGSILVYLADGEDGLLIFRLLDRR